MSLLLERKQLPPTTNMDRMMIVKKKKSSTSSSLSLSPTSLKDMILNRIYNRPAEVYTPSCLLMVQLFRGNLTKFPNVAFEFLSIDEEKRMKKKNKEIAKIGNDLAAVAGRLYCPVLFSAYKGLVLFKHDRSSLQIWNPPESTELALILYNPLTQGTLTVTAPSSKFIYCGFYYHSPTGEYRILYQLRYEDDHVITPAEAAEAGIRFGVLGLRTKKLRVIKNVSNHFPDTEVAPAISNGALHWLVSTQVHDEKYDSFLSKKRASSVFDYSPQPRCSQAILAFGIESEEFQVMPHPGDECDCDSKRQRRHQNKEMRLMEMGEKLCLCDGSYSTKVLDIWVMEDYAKQYWVKKYVIKLDDVLPYTSDPVVIDPYVRAVCINSEGELLLEWYPWYSRGKYYFQDFMFYSLEKGTKRKVKMNVEKNHHSFGNMVVYYSEHDDNHHSSAVSFVDRRSGCVLSLHEDADLNAKEYYADQYDNVMEFLRARSESIKSQLEMKAQLELEIGH